MPDSDALPRELEPMRAQETLEPVHAEGDVVVVASGTRTYPVRNGLIFMGYAADDEEMIRETMSEEHAWQATPAAVAASERFLQTSAPRAVELINLIRQQTGTTKGLRALELGSGSGWVSYLMAKAGFDTYIVDFEPNSLDSGWVYDHPSLGPGKRVVADARWPPFADASFDVVLVKEFAHHVADFELLFAEANRVLRRGGVLAMMEPTMSVWRRFYQLRHPDPHKGHNHVFPERYLFALKRAGFGPVVITASYHHQPRRTATRFLQTLARRGTERGTPVGRLYSGLHLRVLGGGALVYLGEKLRDAPRRSRPAFKPIDPARLTLTREERAAWIGCRDAVEAAAEQLL